MKKLCKLLMA